MCRCLSSSLFWRKMTEAKTGTKYCCTGSPYMSKSKFQKSVKNSNPAVPSSSETGVASVTSSEGRTPYFTKNMVPRFLSPCIFSLHLSVHLQWEPLRCKENVQVREMWMLLRGLGCILWVDFYRLHLIIFFILTVIMFFSNHISEECHFDTCLFATENWTVCFFCNN